MDKVFERWATGKPKDVFFYLPEDLELFDPDQPRVEAGSPTGGQFAPKDGGVTNNRIRIRESAEVESSLSLTTGARNGVFVEPDVQAVRAAQETDVVLARMKDKGYRMPDRVEVYRDDTSADPAGQTRSDDNDTLGLHRLTLRVKIPKDLPSDASLDAATKAAFDKRISTQWGQADAFSVKSFEDIVIHEMGHVQDGRETVERKEVPFQRKWPDREKFLSSVNRPDFIAASHVSDYATESPNEFVAEAFTRLYRGEKLPDDTMKLYDDLKGPKIR